MFARGNHRTATQNNLFLVDQLVEVIARALSPGINDPMSAMTCMDWLQSALIKLSARDDPEFHRFDKDGRLRVIGKCLDFELFCGRIFDQIRPYVATDRNAALRLMEVITNAIDATERNSQRLILRRHGQELIAASEAAGMFPSDVEQLRASLKDHLLAS
jgi:uncharacterized membrane protein